MPSSAENADPVNRAPAAWHIAPGRTITLDRPVFMGILNVTPDSFSDGGRFDAPQRALEHAIRLLEEGAAIIDVGGESTRPGAERIEAQQQIDRVLPVVEAISREMSAAVSIDTTSATVAAAALDAGASIINDVSAGAEDEGMFALAAERGCGLILMHRLRPPRDDSFSHEYTTAPRYDDVVREVRDFLLGRASAAIAAGVAREHIVIDPGLGFGKTVEQNYELIARTGELAASGYAVLSAASRKSFVGAAAGIDDPAVRDAATVGVTIHHFLQGVRLFRVHDVRPHREALAVTAAVERASKTGSHGAKRG